MLPLNRRKYSAAMYSLGSFSELEILAAMVRKYQKPVHLTFNALYYIPEQYPEIATIIRQCMGLGFRSYILADPALICYLRQEHIDCEIHLSGEIAEVNSRMFFRVSAAADPASDLSPEKQFYDMRRVVQAGHGEEFEAFVLNELCHFTGAFCNSLHCDEMGYLCRVPYRLEPEERRERAEDRSTSEQLPWAEDGYLCGATGCGLCALYQLRGGGNHTLKAGGTGQLR